MRSPAESEVRSGSAGDVETLGVAELCRIPVRCAEQDEHALAGADGLPAQPLVDEGGTTDDLGGALEPEYLLDRRLDQRRITLEQYGVGRGVPSG